MLRRYETQVTGTWVPAIRSGSGFPPSPDKASDTLTLVIYEEREVPGGLVGVVSRLWYLEAVPERRYEKILPLPFVHLIVNLSDPYRLFDREGSHTLVDGAFVSGIQSDHLVIESPLRIKHVGAEFEPAGFGAVTDAPATSVAGRVQPARDLLDAADDLVARLRTLDRTPAEATETLAEFLEGASAQRLGPDVVVQRALAAIHERPDIPIADLAAAARLSHRTLIARFRRATGLTPKAYAQLWRFHRFVSAVQMDSDAPDWAGLAAASGFYDQPHVIRAFRRFSGWTPAEYYRRVAEFGPAAASFVPLDEVPGGAVTPSRTPRAASR